MALPAFKDPIFTPPPYQLPVDVNPTGIAADYQAALQDRILVVPVGSGLRQIGGFAFDYTGDEIVTMDNEITDHWLEDNTAVQDHIGVKPTMVTMRGFSSNLAANISTLNLLTTLITGVENLFSRPPAYLGQYGQGTIDAIQKALSQAENVAIQVEQAAARALQIYNIFTAPTGDAQQKAFAQLSALRLSRAVFAVFTPFQIFPNMAIVGLQAKQSAASRTISDFTVTMKQLNFSSDASAAMLSNTFSDPASHSLKQSVGATLGSATTAAPGTGFVS
jgi:hypothetical protein